MKDPCYRLVDPPSLQVGDLILAWGTFALRSSALHSLPVVTSP